MTKKQIDSVGLMCQSLIEICNHARSVQAEYLKERGLTMTQARAMNADQREALQSDYSVWFKARKLRNSLK